jgi:hypothetical protein
MMQGGVVNVIADAGQSFAYATAGPGPEIFPLLNLPHDFFVQ